MTLPLLTSICHVSLVRRTLQWPLVQTEHASSQPKEHTPQHLGLLTRGHSLTANCLLNPVPLVLAADLVGTVVLRQANASSNGQHAEGNREQPSLRGHSAAQQHPVNWKLKSPLKGKVRHIELLEHLSQDEKLFCSRLPAASADHKTDSS